jgi:hypothetical protein
VRRRRYVPDRQLVRSHHRLISIRDPVFGGGVPWERRPFSFWAERRALTPTPSRQAPRGLAGVRPPPAPQRSHALWSAAFVLSAIALLLRSGGRGMPGGSMCAVSCTGGRAPLSASQPSGTRVLVGSCWAPATRGPLRAEVVVDTREWYRPVSGLEIVVRSRHSVIREAGPAERWIRGALVALVVSGCVALLALRERPLEQPPPSLLGRWVPAVPYGHETFLVIGDDSLEWSAGPGQVEHRSLRGVRSLERAASSQVFAMHFVDEGGTPCCVSNSWPAVARG